MSYYVCEGLHFLRVGQRPVYIVRKKLRGWREDPLFQNGRYSLQCTLHRNHVLLGVYRVNIFQSYQELTRTYTSILTYICMHTTSSNSLLSATRVRRGRRRAAHNSAHRAHRARRVARTTRYHSNTAVRTSLGQRTHPWPPRSRHAPQNRGAPGSTTTAVTTAVRTISVGR